MPELICIPLAVSKHSPLPTASPEFVLIFPNGCYSAEELQSPNLVLICIFLILVRLNFLFICLLPICISSSENHLFIYLAHLLIGLFSFLFNSVSSLYILYSNQICS